MFSETLLLVIAIFVAFCHFVHQYYNYFKVRDFPQIKPVPFYGNCRKISEGYHFSDLMRDAYKKLKSQGPVAGIYIYIRKMVMLTDLEMVKTVTIKEFDSFTSKGMYSNKKDDPLSDSLIFLNGDEWRLLRRKMSPSFTSGKIKMMFSTLDDISDRLVDVIHKKSSQSMETKSLFARLLTDFIGSVCFGFECNTLNGENKEFFERSAEAFSSAMSIKEHFRISFPNLSRMLRLRVASAETKDYYLGIISEAFKQREQNEGAKRNDLLDSLFDLHKSGDISFTQVAANSV